jgi:hypothetical protein
MLQRSASALLLALWAVSLPAFAAVTITPPNAAGPLAGSLAGQASVSSRGASEYSIKLPVPPGTAGMAPAIGLDYDSERGTDSGGLGWRLGGLSTVTRCPRTLATDATLHAVDLSALDAYCLDGQRLLKISGTDGATAEYRTEVEGFSRIKSFGSNAANGPERWTVEIRNGQVLSFGGSAGNATVVAPGTSAVMVWLLARSADPHGNYVSYQYQAANASGEHVVTQIRYTGNDAAGLVPYNAVNFLYEARSDVYQGYYARSALQRPNRLRAIETRTGTAADGSGGRLIRQWILAYTYSASSARSLLQSVTDCDGSGRCLPATTFTWTQRDPKGSG